MTAVCLNDQRQATLGKGHLEVENGIASERFVGYECNHLLKSSTTRSKAMRSITARCMVAIFGVILCLTGPLRAAVTIYVTTTADSGPGSLRQAIADSRSGDEIWFLTNGVISLLSGELQITNHLAIIGPGATNLAVSGNGSSRVFNISAGTTSSISGLTIRDGRTTNGASAVVNSASGSNGDSGGGLYNRGTLALNNCIITANTTGNGGNGENGVNGDSIPGTPGGHGGAGGHGGGFYNEGVLMLRACVVVANRTGIGGNGGNGGAGGISGTAPAPFGGSGGWGGSGGFGGAIYNSGVVTLNTCILSQNHAGNGGHGGVGGNGGYCPPCRPPSNIGFPGVSGSGGTGGGGGGIWNEHGTVTATNCSFEQNLCGMGGMGITSPTAFAGPPGAGGSGGGMGNNGQLVVSVCAFVGNSCGANGIYQGGTLGGPGGFGGGLFNGTNGSSIVSSCTLSGNTGGNGGGIFNTGLVSVISSTIANNSAYYGDGGGMYTRYFFNVCCSSNDTVRNTLIAGNSPYDMTRFLTSEGHNLIGVRSFSPSGLRTNGCNCDFVGSITNRIDPLLGPLQDNGGPILTHALLAGSPAIDAGINTGVPFDTRGQPRTIDNPAVTNTLGSDGTDIGAFEVNHILTSTEARRVGNDVLVRFTTVSDKTYGVEYRPEVGEGPWSELPGFITGTGGIVTYIDTGAGTLPYRFYRVFERSTP